MPAQRRRLLALPGRAVTQRGARELRGPKAVNLLKPIAKERDFQVVAVALAVSARVVEQVDGGEQLPEMAVGDGWDGGGDGEGLDGDEQDAHFIGMIGGQTAQGVLEPGHGREEAVVVEIAAVAAPPEGGSARSEERRVGKEGRSR